MVVFHAMCSGIPVEMCGNDWIYDVEANSIGITYTIGNIQRMYFPNVSLNGFLEMCNSISDEYLSSLLAQLTLRSFM